MCTVSVKVNEALLRGMRPELNSTAAIRQWAQQQIDLRIQQMEARLQSTAQQGNNGCTQYIDALKGDYPFNPCHPCSKNNNSLILDYAHHNLSRDR